MSEKIVPAGHGEAAKEYGIGILRGTIGAIPWVGSLLNEVLFDARSRLKQERLNNFFIRVAEDVAKLKGDSIDRDFMNSEEFSDLIEEVCLRVARTQNEERRARFKGVLLNAFQGRTDPDFSTFFLDILSEITEPELTILQGFAKYLPAKAAHDRRGEQIDVGAIDYKNGVWGFDGTTAKQLVQALIAKGLLADDSQGRWSSQPFTIVIPTELGGRFLDWLRQ
jgi:hypothetical protein